MKKRNIENTTLQKVYQLTLADNDLQIHFNPFHLK